MVFFVTGASGSGKTACLPNLRELLPDIIMYDFDEIGVPDGADTAWRQNTTEVWLQKMHEHQASGRDVIICGGAVFGEILACPTANEIDQIRVCLLDCHDVVRIDRIRSRGTYGDTQDMLNWAAWQRLHAVDPQWRPDVIQSVGAEGMHWHRWESWQRGDPRWNTWVLDTSDLSIPDVADEIERWVRGNQLKNLST
jgi:hypothetical protein